MELENWLAVVFVAAVLGVFLAACEPLANGLSAGSGGESTSEAGETPEPIESSDGGPTAAGSSEGDAEPPGVSDDGAAGAEDDAVPDREDGKEMDWDQIAELEKEQKFQAAFEAAEGLLETARDANDQDNWTRALVKLVQLRTGLHGYETAVRLLQDEEWPDKPESRVVLDLFYAHGLTSYLRAYSWEIRQRERVDTGDQIDLKAWTLDQIAAEAHRVLARIWLDRESWGERGTGFVGAYLQSNSYPRGIRGTFRDTVSYLWVELLADTSLWSTGDSNRLFRIPVEGLLGSLPPRQAEDPDAHPLERLAAVLDDLEVWHSRAERDEAALEARLERLRRVHGSFDRAEDRLVIRRHLEERMEEFDFNLAWWSVGQAEIAQFVRQENATDALVRAREIALAGADRHPESVGGERCRHIVAAIEAPRYSMTSMILDGSRRRSIAVMHRNLERLFFRAYAVDLESRLGRAKDYNLLPADQEVQKLVRGGEPTAEWVVDLPATADYRDHRTYVTPDLDSRGLVVVVASVEPGFRADGNLRSAVNLILSDLVLVTRQGEARISVTVRSGESGRAVSGADVSLYRYDYRRGHRRVESKTTGDDGRAVFRSGSPRAGHFFLARKGEDVSLDAANHYFQRRGEKVRQARALVYTDRSVYRPGQRLLWKAVAYGGLEGNFQTSPGEKLVLELVDANGETVESQDVVANRFGSVSGAFEIPAAGRLLGRWRLRASTGDSAHVVVEEYKRPTFEVEIKEPSEPLRLNRPAEVAGSARYYFGLPVVEGSVAWRVSREPVYPPWWGWYYGGGNTRAATVASGVAPLDADGVFRLMFTPEADEREAGSGVSYRYRLSADATDPGGETRSAERVFTLGFVTVKAALEPAKRFFDPTEAAAFTIRRLDLDGTPRAGEGTWQLVALEQPQMTLLPAEQPLPEPPGRPGPSGSSDNDAGEEAGAGSGARRYETEGDRLRPRWQGGYDLRQVLRSWTDGDGIGSGEVAHDDRGKAEVELPALVPGAYRLRYETRDPFGAVFKTAAEFVIALDSSTPLALPAVLMAETGSVPVGGTARLLVHSGLSDQELMLEIFSGGEKIDESRLESMSGARVIEIPVGSELRGGFSTRLTALRDHQLMILHDSIFVPWDDRKLEIAFSTFRDKLRPGDKESWRVSVKSADEAALVEGSAELLAYMYDKSLDLFAAHSPVDPLSLYPTRTGWLPLRGNLGSAGPVWSRRRDFAKIPSYPHLSVDRLTYLDNYGIGGLGRSGFARRMKVAAAPMMADSVAIQAEGKVALEEEARLPASAPLEADAAPQSEALRTDFSETAFWEPHLLLAGEGEVAFEFEVPDSVTEWSVWVHALTKDLRAGRLESQARTVKELLVRPSLPRFLREGDRAELRVVVNNAGESDLSGTLDFDIEDPVTESSVLADFGLEVETVTGVPFSVETGGSTTLTFPVHAPSRVGPIAFRVVGRAGDFSDGELRPIPVLPGRMHLVQSRFATLRDKDRRELRFEDLRADDDSSRIDEQMVVTLDGQLFYGVLQALPYLVEYPYECTEQTLNRFVSTGILSSLYDKYPAVGKMAKEFSARDTRLETWEATDSNRKMALEETPWLIQSRGGADKTEDLVKVLDPRIASAERKGALAKLRKSQTSLGGFPWWPGGPPSPYMTLYLLAGFSRALEFDIDIPRDMVEPAWGYMHRHYVDKLVAQSIAKDCCWEIVTFLNYVLSSYPDESWTGGVFDKAERKRMLDFSFEHWKLHSPLLKAYLALTLERSGRSEDARLVFDSVMDSSKTGRDEGTYWAPEDRGWLWYNDRIETHAFALRTLTELEPDDERRHGLVQWLMLNKKLSHWKSTRATAEVIYALTHYLRHEGILGAREAVDVKIGPRVESFVFEPDEYTGKNNQIVLVGEDIVPAEASAIVVEKETPGLLFASATWHFSTEKLPEEASGDFFQVTRKYFRRFNDGREWVIEPMTEGTELGVGEQVEVQLSLRAKHAAEYVHLRDPRPAGFEPESNASSFKWNLGLGWYEEIRDSGTNFFFEWLPVGEYTFKYRLRASTAGTFKTGPATLQSMYAPEFAAYSAGHELSIEH
ncbi:MAG: MG2 domain-containing protein [Acidobacteriota bacterium]|nr:MG2 domain-containing protein [Acidobacteriota bacterium]